MKFFAFLVLLHISAVLNLVEAQSHVRKLPAETLDGFRRWTADKLVNGGRIDAVRWVGGPTVVCGSRGGDPGKLFISHDYGRTWQFLNRPTQYNITCIAETKNPRRFFVLSGKGEVFGTEDGGVHFTMLKKLTDSQHSFTGQETYGLMVTPNGVLLATDTQKDGGHIYRSTDGGKSWLDVGPVSRKGLYRMENIGNGVVVNGWEGAVFKSIDEGRTWNRIQQLTGGSPLYATEYIGHNSALQADENGNIYRSSNTGYSWKKVDSLADAADDFITTTYGAVYYSTYTGRKDVYISLDYGRSWNSLGTVPTEEGDFLDHGIYMDAPDSIIVLAGTNRGYIIRNAISKQWMYNVVKAFNNAKPIAADRLRDIQRSIVGSIIDHKELNSPEDVLPYKGFAYVPCRDGNNIAIIDYRNPGSPRIAYSLRDPDILDAFGVAVRGDYLYVLSMTNCRVSVYNIADPYAPRKVSSIQVGGQGSFLKTYNSDYTRLRKIYIDGDYAYVTHSSESKVYILNIKDPVHPAIVSSFHTGDGAFAVLARKNALYLAGFGPGSSVIAVDIKDKAHPVITSKVFDSTILDGTCALSLAGSTLFSIANHAGTFSSYDVSDPLRLKLLDHLNDPDMKGPNRLVALGKKAFVINSENDSMTILDISDSKAPKVEYYVQEPLLKRVYGMNTDGKYLLLAARDGRSFVILDMDKL